MITKTFGIDYREETKRYSSEALTLDPDFVGENESGWTIEGEIHEDYFEWVNDFIATHPVYGKIEGNFESEVTAECEIAHDHFVKNHPYSEWDYYDI